MYKKKLESILISTLNCSVFSKNKELFHDLGLVPKLKHGYEEGATT